MVIAIDPQSPCVKQGIIQGSVIATVAGQSVSDVVNLQRIINDTPPTSCGIAVAKTAGQVVSVQD